MSFKWERPTPTGSLEELRAKHTELLQKRKQSEANLERLKKENLDELFICRDLGYAIQSIECDIDWRLKND